jgi:hypothetical protein
MKKIILFTAMCFFIFSCSVYQPPMQKNIQNQNQYNYSYDLVWDAVINYFADNGLSIKTIEKSSGLIVTEYYKTKNIDEDIVDCGTVTAGGIINDGEYSFNVRVTKSGEIVVVKINTFYNAKFVFIGENIIHCQSTGALEQKIFDYIADYCKGH